MPTNKKPKKRPSLAIQERHNKRLFLPMDAADAGKLALRFRMALTRAREGTAAWEDARCLAESVMMAGLITDLDGSDLDDADLAASEECLRLRLASAQASDWRLGESESRSLCAVINEHDRQLHETRLQSLVKATERFERLLKSVETLDAMFVARRAENARSG